MAVLWVETKEVCPDPVPYVKFLEDGFYKTQMLWHKMNERPPYITFSGRTGLSIPVMLMSVFEGMPQLIEAEITPDDQIWVDDVPLEDTSIEVVGWAFHEENY